MTPAAAPRPPAGRRLRPWLAALLTPLLISGCGAAPPSRPSRGSATGQPPAAARLRVVTSVLPVGLFTRAVAGDCATVEALFPAGTDLHDLPVSPRSLARLRDADVLVLNGLGLEDPLEPLIAAAAPPRLRRVASAAGVPPLAGSNRHQHAHAHDHTPAGAAVNPHVWLDPRRAATQVRTIRDGLAVADPGRAACFRRNADRFLAELERLDGDLARQLAPHAGRGLVSFHDLAPYFADRYGLRSESVVELPSDNPSVADLQRVAEALRRQRGRALLVDPQADHASLRALAQDLDRRLLPFDPIERASEADAQRPAHYLEAMRRNGTAVLESVRLTAP